jgi:hypothetical protein
VLSVLRSNRKSSEDSGRCRNAQKIPRRRNTTKNTFSPVTLWPPPPSASARRRRIARVNPLGKSRLGHLDVVRNLGGLFVVPKYAKLTSDLKNFEIVGGPSAAQFFYGRISIFDRRDVDATTDSPSSPYGEAARSRREEGKRKLFGHSVHGTWVYLSEKFPPITSSTIRWVDILHRKRQSTGVREEILMTVWLLGKRSLAEGEPRLLTSVAL